MIGEAAMSASTGSMPPTLTRSGRPNCPEDADVDVAGGPDRSHLGASWHWKTATKRVMPPSTGSSKTMSAASRPLWAGR